jgi:hypothetical protein
MNQRRSKDGLAEISSPTWLVAMINCYKWPSAR